MSRSDAGSADRALRRLARLHGVQTHYVDGLGAAQRCGPDVLRPVLEGLGVATTSRSDLVDAGVDRLLEVARRRLEPVIALHGHDRSVRMTVPAPVRGAFRLRIEQEGGQQRTLEGRVEELRCRGERRVAGRRFHRLELHLPDDLPHGYHRLTLELGGERAESLLIVAPQRAPDPGTDRWGLFVPLFALHRAGARRHADLADLAELMRYTGEAGGSFVGLLPLLAASGDERSPYSPISRLFWNERILAREWLAAGVADSAGRLDAPPPANAESADRERLAPGRAVDYEHTQVCAEALLDDAVEAALGSQPDSALRAELAAWAEQNEEARRYARFRAVAAERGPCWWQWPDSERDVFDPGAAASGPGDEQAYRRALVAQWLAAGQLERLGRTSSSAGVDLYLDLPLGVPRASFDAWRYREQFAAGCGVGAPADGFFRSGQNWGLLPPLPEAQRRAGYSYFIGAVRNHLRHAGLLRIDHVMGLHRLYWVPEGLPATSGTYVRYPASELYAILKLEAHRHGAALVGEDLGTVPPVVRESMARHGVRRMHVLVSQLNANPEAAIPAAPRQSLASLSTHDMPPVSGFWTDDDLERGVRLGRSTEAEAAESAHQRGPVRDALRAFLGNRGLLHEESRAGEIARGCLEVLARGEAELLAVDLEELWGETIGHNLPGDPRTFAQDGRVIWPANWSRRALYDLDEILADPELADALRRLDRARREKGDRG